MNYPQHPKGSGALFVNNERTQENHPHYRGNIVLTTEQINRVIEMINAGIEPKIQLAAWARKSAAGADYISIETEAYMKQQAAPPPIIQPPIQPQAMAPAPMQQPMAPAPVQPVQPVPVQPTTPVAPVQPMQPAPIDDGFADKDIPF